MLFQELTLEIPHQLNAGLYVRYMELAGTDRIRQTHFFSGRFENSYIDMADIPDITSVLALVKEHAGCHLGRAAETLKIGYWFNAMGPGQRTAPHHHDENDELLSAVYYIRVPENSGNLILQDADNNNISICPQEGKLVMFAPAVLHEVTTNLSADLRLSVAMNIGPLEG
ncbi:MAG: 2OG-Fe(II) oxygenase family protein [Gammaproteobacteria bacterium]|nr:2OG-Fe(II) oxygenase family protein [Gammaproteobacteria bacterium]